MVPGRGGFIGEALGVGVARTPGNGADVTARWADAWRHQGSTAAFVREGKGGNARGKESVRPRGQTRASAGQLARRESHSAHYRDALCGKSREATVGVRRKGKLTGGTRLSVTLR